MTLDERLPPELAKWRPDGGRQTLTVLDAAPGWSASFTLDRADAVGCLLWEMTLRRTEPAGAEGLMDWAERVARRVTGLLEPLRVVEVDTRRNEALLRSQEPAHRGGDLLYYELLLKSTGEATLRRYQAGRQGDARRQQVAFALTNEALIKLVHDLTADS